MLFRSVKFLRDDPSCRFVSLIDVTAVDYPGREKRFDVVYHLLSPTLNARIRLRAEAGETTQVPSIIEVFPGTDWFEREAYDLYGVIFTGHPDMRIDPRNHFAVEFQHQTQHAVSRRMLRPEVDSEIAECSFGHDAASVGGRMANIEWRMAD